eukprot:TRINITY_DN1646_c0_g1_i4.p1 TRINITY_DN1646_c0_g1~~TRINITY_DN1646_c0_g1_i4.p1  ORF type:complete len:4926 (+),score=974.20 TRINITY_DN1646_c0_g1_i4:1136-14779(+)
MNEEILHGNYYIGENAVGRMDGQPGYLVSENVQLDNLIHLEPTIRENHETTNDDNFTRKPQKNIDKDKRKISSSKYHSNKTHDNDETEKTEVHIPEKSGMLSGFKSFFTGKKKIKLGKFYTFLENEEEYKEYLSLEDLPDISSYYTENILHKFHAPKILRFYFHWIDTHGVIISEDNHVIEVLMSFWETCYRQKLSKKVDLNGIVQVLDDAMKYSFVKNDAVYHLGSITRFAEEYEEKGTWIRSGNISVLDGLKKRYIDFYFSEPLSDFNIDLFKKHGDRRMRALLDDLFRDYLNKNEIIAKNLFSTIIKLKTISISQIWELFLNEVNIMKNLSTYFLIFFSDLREDMLPNTEQLDTFILKILRKKSRSNLDNIFTELREMKVVMEGSDILNRNFFVIDGILSKTGEFILSKANGYFLDFERIDLVASIVGQENMGIFIDRLLSSGNFEHFVHNLHTVINYYKNLSFDYSELILFWCNKIYTINRLTDKKKQLWDIIYYHNMVDHFSMIVLSISGSSFTKTELKKYAEFFDWSQETTNIFDQYLEENLRKLDFDNVQVLVEQYSKYRIGISKILLDNTHENRENPLTRHFKLMGYISDHIEFTPEQYPVIKEAICKLFISATRKRSLSLSYPINLLEKLLKHREFVENYLDDSYFIGIAKNLISPYSFSRNLNNLRDLFSFFRDSNLTLSFCLNLLDKICPSLIEKKDVTKKAIQEFGGESSIFCRKVLTLSLIGEHDPFTPKENLVICAKNNLKIPLEIKDSIRKTYESFYESLMSGNIDKFTFSHILNRHDDISCCYEYFEIQIPSVKDIEQWIQEMNDTEHTLQYYLKLLQFLSTEGCPVKDLYQYAKSVDDDQHNKALTLHRHRTYLKELHFIIDILGVKNIEYIETFDYIRGSSLTDAIYRSIKKKESFAEMTTELVALFCERSIQWKRDLFINQETNLEEIDKFKEVLKNSDFTQEAKKFFEFCDVGSEISDIIGYLNKIAYINQIHNFSSVIERLDITIDDKPFFGDFENIDRRSFGALRCFCQYISKNSDSLKIRELKTLVMKYDLLIPYDFPLLFFEILEEIQECGEVILFLKNYTREEFEDQSEMIYNEFISQAYQRGVINNLRLAYGILSSFLIDSFSDYTVLLEELLSNNLTQGLIESIKSCRLNIEQIKTYFSDLRSDFNSAADMCERMNKGSFISSLSKNSSYSVLTDLGENVLEYKNSDLDERIKVIDFYNNTSGDLGEEENSRIEVFSTLLEKLKFLYQVHELRLELHDIGHPLYQNSTRAYLLSDDYQMSNEVNELSVNIQNWKDNIFSTRTSNPLLLFLTIQEVTLLLNAIMDKNTDSVLVYLKKMIPHTLPFSIEETVENYSDILQNEVSGLKTLEILSKFLDEIYRKTIEASNEIDLKNIHGWRETGTDLYSMDYPIPQPGQWIINSENDPDQILRILLQLYNERLPEEFEILYCSELITSSMLELFLQRVLAFSNSERIFTLINVELLDYHLQEIILDYQNTYFFGKTVNIRYVITNSKKTILSESSALRTFKLTKIISGELTYNILNRNKNSIRYYCGDPGQGKTFAIRNSVPNRLEIAINEDFDINLVISQMELLDGKSIFFNISGYSTKILSSVLNFFMNLFLFNMISDTNTGDIFFLQPEIKYDIHIELPSYNGDEKTRTLKSDYFLNLVPIIRYSGILINLENVDMIIDEKVILVTRYLIAYQENVSEDYPKQYYQHDKSKIRKKIDMVMIDNPVVLADEITDKYVIANIHVLWEALDEYLPIKNPNTMEKRFWIERMYRRAKFIDTCSTYKYNSDFHDKFGSLLMKAMLTEVTNLCNPDNMADWTTHADFQLIYDCSENETEGTLDFIKLSKNPIPDEAEWSKLGFRTSTLYNEELLIGYLSRALSIPVEDIIGVLKEEEYVLTMDYTCKMINMHEQRECGIPTIIQGETGVGKTKLLEVYSKLLNISTPQSRKNPLGIFKNIVDNIKENIPTNHWNELNDMVHSNNFDIEKVVDILTECNNRSVFIYILYAITKEYFEHSERVNLEADVLFNGIFDYKSKLLECKSQIKKTYTHLVQIVSSSSKYEEWYGSRDIFFSNLEKDSLPLYHIAYIYSYFLLLSGEQNYTGDIKDYSIYLLEHLLDFKYVDVFYCLPVHGSLKSHDIQHFIQEISELAEEFQNITFTVFFDEGNTTSVMGLLKEIICDKSVAGNSLPHNIFAVLACNPKLDREEQTNKKSLTGDSSLDFRAYYQVKKFPPTMISLIWDYGSLAENQELEYVRYRLLPLSKFYSKSFEDVSVVADIILRAQKLVKEIIGADSAVSQRDLKRCVNLFVYFSKNGYQEDQIMEHNWSDEESKSGSYQTSASDDAFLDDSDNSDFSDVEFQDIHLEGGYKSERENQKQSLALSIALCYYMRLEGKERILFDSRISQYFGEEDGYIQKTLKAEIEIYMKALERVSLKGLAQNQAFTENIFVILVSIFSLTPLIILGKPGTSKTLAFNTVMDCLKKENRSLFSKVMFPNVFVKPFPYQCNRKSSSSEIASLFEAAIEAQTSTTKSVVFLDEAGLPEEKMESLKALHYYLDNPEVGFIAITNHPLDAAKSNRAITVRRDDPDVTDLIQLARGCLDIDIDEQSKVIERLCKAFSSVLKHYVVDGKDKHFYGLRDFYHLLRYIKRKETEGISFTPQIVFEALERNMNGIVEFDKMAKTFFETLGWSMSDILKKRNTIDIIKDSINDKAPQSSNLNDSAVRFKLIIDGTPDESALRILFSGGILDKETTTVLYGSNFDKDKNSSYNYRHVSDIKLALQAGKTVAMINIETLHEAFYDLYNQRYSKVRDQDKNKDIYYTRVAIGSQHKFCEVHKDFQCIVFVNSRDLIDIPEPFLNRFEKFLISTQTLFELSMKDSPFQDNGTLAAIVRKSEQFVKAIGQDSFIGYTNDCTLEALISQGLEKNHSLDENGKVYDTESTFIYVISGLMKLMTAESILRFKDYIPTRLLETYLKHQEHFNLDNFINRLDFEQKKYILYTRSKPFIYNLMGSSSSISREVEIHKFSSFKSEEECSKVLELFSDSHSSNVFLMLIDTAVIDHKRIVHLQWLIERYERPGKVFVLLIHFQYISRAHFTRSYGLFPAHFQYGWDFLYFETCGGGLTKEEPVNIGDWLSYLCLEDQTLDLTNNIKFYTTYAVNSALFRSPNFYRDDLGSYNSSKYASKKAAMLINLLSDTTEDSIGSKFISFCVKKYTQTFTKTELEHFLKKELNYKDLGDSINNFFHQTLSSIIGAIIQEMNSAFSFDLLFDSSSDDIKNLFLDMIEEYVDVSKSKISGSYSVISHSNREPEMFPFSEKVLEKHRDYVKSLKLKNRNSFKIVERIESKGDLVISAAKTSTFVFDLYFTEFFNQYFPDAHGNIKRNVRNILHSMNYKQSIPALHVLLLNPIPYRLLSLNVYIWNLRKEDINLDISDILIKGITKYLDSHTLSHNNIELIYDYIIKNHKRKSKIYSTLITKLFARKYNVTETGTFINLFDEIKPTQYNEFMFILFEFHISSENIEDEIEKIITEDPISRLLKEDKKIPFQYQNNATTISQSIFNYIVNLPISVQNALKKYLKFNIKENSSWESGLLKQSFFYLLLKKCCQEKIVDEYLDTLGSFIEKNQKWGKIVVSEIIENYSPEEIESLQSEGKFPVNKKTFESAIQSQRELQTLAQQDPAKKTHKITEYENMKGISVLLKLFYILHYQSSITGNIRLGQVHNFVYNSRSKIFILNELERVTTIYNSLKGNVSYMNIDEFTELDSLCNMGEYKGDLMRVIEHYVNKFNVKSISEETVPLLSLMYSNDLRGNCSYISYGYDSYKLDTESLNKVVSGGAKLEYNILGEIHLQLADDFRCPVYNLDDIIRKTHSLNIEKTTDIVILLKTLCGYLLHILAVSEISEVEQKTIYDFITDFSLDDNLSENQTDILEEQEDIFFNMITSIVTLVEFFEENIRYGYCEFYNLNLIFKKPIQGSEKDKVVECLTGLSDTMAINMLIEHEHVFLKIIEQIDTFKRYITESLAICYEFQHGNDSSILIETDINLNNIVDTILFFRSLRRELMSQQDVETNLLIKFQQLENIWIDTNLSIKNEPAEEPIENDTDDSQSDSYKEDSESEDIYEGFVLVRILNPLFIVGPNGDTTTYQGNLQSLNYLLKFASKEFSMNQIFVLNTEDGVLLTEDLLVRIYTMYPHHSLTVYVITDISHIPISINNYVFRILKNNPVSSLVKFFTENIEIIEYPIIISETFQLVPIDIDVQAIYGKRVFVYSSDSCVSVRFLPNETLYHFHNTMFYQFLMQYCIQIDKPIDSIETLQVNNQLVDMSNLPLFNGFLDIAINWKRTLSANGSFYFFHTQIPHQNVLQECNRFFNIESGQCSLVNDRGMCITEDEDLTDMIFYVSNDVLLKVTTLKDSDESSVDFWIHDTTTNMLIESTNSTLLDYRNVRLFPNMNIRSLIDKNGDVVVKECDHKKLHTIQIENHCMTPPDIISLDVGPECTTQNLLDFYLTFWSPTQNFTLSRNNEQADLSTLLSNNDTLSLFPSNQ